MHRYTAQIAIPGQSPQRVYVNADNSSKAKAILEAQYGQGSVKNLMPAN